MHIKTFFTAFCTHIYTYWRWMIAAASYHPVLAMAITILDTEHRTSLSHNAPQSLRLKLHASGSVMTAELQYLQITRAVWDLAMSSSFTHIWEECFTHMWGVAPGVVSASGEMESCSGWQAPAWPPGSSIPRTRWLQCPNTNQKQQSRLRFPRSPVFFSVGAHFGQLYSVRNNCRNIWV